MNEDTKESFWSLEHSFKLFDSLIDNRLFSRALLIFSIACLVISLLFDWGSFLAVFDEFKTADLYKISLFVQGISPYSSPQVWLAPYPPFYFIMWVVPYYLLSNVSRLSIDQTYFSIRVLSTFLSAVCALLIYKQLTSQSFSRQKSISLSSIFVLCSLSGLIEMTGDFIGLVFLAMGCLFLVRKKVATGLVFVSLSVAFKVQPIIGLALLLLSLVLTNIRKGAKARIVEYLSVVAGAGILLGAIPVLLIPDAFSSFFLYDAAHIQYYFFNIFTGLVDVLLNLLPVADTGTILRSADIAWWLAIICFLAFLLRYLLKEGFFTYADPVDILSLGIIVWLIMLKQTEPNYFLWALVPLLARGRTRSLLYVLAGDFFGSLFFGLAYVFGIPANYVGVPNIGSSIAFLIGGVLFVLFLVFAMIELMHTAKIERKNVLARDVTLQTGQVR